MSRAFLFFRNNDRLVSSFYEAQIVLQLSYEVYNVSASNSRTPIHGMSNFLFVDELTYSLQSAVHFWAPTFKWGLVIAGLADINRPIEKVSTAQQSGCLLWFDFLYRKLKIHKKFKCAALAATGIIWSRYATQIIPVNYNLLSVNVFVAITGLYQLARKNG